MARVVYDSRHTWESRKARSANARQFEDAADCHSFRVITSDQQIFELYYEAAPIASIPDNKRWVLYTCLDRRYQRTLPTIPSLSVTHQLLQMILDPCFAAFCPTPCFRART